MKITVSRSSFRSERARRDPRGGFALVIALGMMSLVLMLILAITVQATVETRIAEQSLTRLSARENARLGLMIALGELQKHAGPDQRVTARAELLGEMDAKQLWTGVWPTTGGNPPVWLVSSADGLPTGNTPNLVEDPSLPSTAERRLNLLKNEGPAWQAEAALIGLPSNGTQRAGAYAFWVGDEGVKADLSVIGDEPVFPEQDFIRNPNTPGALTANQRAELRSRLLQSNTSARFDRLINDFVSGGDFEQLEQDTAGRLRKVSSLPSLELSLDGRAIPANLSQELTLGNFGVLADTRAGGLRTNLEIVLSDAPGSSDPFRNGDLEHFVDTERNFIDFNTAAYGSQRGLRGFSGAGGSISENFATGATGTTGTFPRLPNPAADEFRGFHHLSPIITEFMLVCAVYEAGGNPALRYFFDVELYNPYPFPLLLNDARKHALTVFVSGLPEIQIVRSRFDADDNLIELQRSEWIDLDSAPLSNGLPEVSSWLQIAGTQNSETGPAYLLPGETYRLQEPNPSWQSGGLRKNLGSTPSNVNDEDIIEIFARSTNVAARDEGRLNVRLVRGSRFPGGTPLPGGAASTMPTMFEIRNAPYTAEFLYNFGGRNAAGRNPGVPAVIPGPGGRPIPNPANTVSRRRYLAGLTMAGAANNVTDAYSFAIHFSLGGSRVFGSPNVAAEGFPDPAAELLRFWDLRNPIIDHDAFHTFVPGPGEPEVSLPLAAFFSSGSDDPVETLDDLTLFNPTQRFSDSSAGSDLRNRDQRIGNHSDVRLYDVPSVRPTTLAGFRHAFFVNRPPLSLTSPWGGSLNDAFDRYFLSSVPDSGWAPGSGVHLPNPRMTVLNSNASPSIDDLRGADSARHFLVAGAFNINSISVEAWRAVLSQDFPADSNNDLGRQADFGNRNLSYFPLAAANQVGDNAGLDSKPPKNFFARFNFAALAGFRPERTDAELFSLPVTSTRDGLSGQATRQGVRIFGSGADSLPGRDGDLTIQHLAFHTVRLMKDRAANTTTPFFSLSEFIQSGLLQEAIDAVGPAISAAENPAGTELAAVTPINEGLSGFEPTYLLQSDIITALAGFFSARSDTFTIRSYGETRDPLTGKVTGNAMIEAKVQRYPEIVDGSTAGTFERPFRILSTRWINP